MSQGSLQKELCKKRPFAAPEQEAAINLMRTHDALQLAFTRLFKQHGITHQQYNVLRILRGHAVAEGRRHAGLACREIAEQMITFDPDVTRLVDRLVKQGYAERIRSEQDRRVVRVSITATGKKVLAELDAPVLALHREQLEHLNRAELKELNRLLVKAREKPDEKQ